MKDEYIIINKTELEKKLTELKTKLSEESGSFFPLQRIIGEDSGKIRMIQEVISKSTPLIPVVEKAFDAGKEHGQDYKFITWNKPTYIENLKLEI